MRRKKTNRLRAALGTAVLAGMMMFAVPSASGQGVELDLSLPDMGNPSSQALPAGEAARIGLEMMREIRQEVDLVDDPAVNAYIRDLGARIAAATDTPAAAYRFFVVDDPRINAFAMPGGYIGVHSGLITASRNESELGSVIAHELSHVTQRHIARRIAAAEQTGLRTAAMVLAGLVIGSQHPQAGAAAVTTGMASGVDSQLAYSRDHEREADRTGIRILARANLDPTGMADFFEVLQADNRYRSRAPAFLSTHPLTRARIADTRSMARELKPESVFESPDYGYARARLQVAAASHPEDAVDDFRARIEADDAPARRYGLAIALIADDAPEQAADLLESLLDDAGAHDLIYVGLAEAALAEDRIDRALARIDDGLSLFPDSTGLQVGRVEALLQADRARDALASTRDLTHQQPDAPGIWQLHARAASAANDPDESALAMARYYAAQGDLQAGLSQLRRISEISATPRQRARAEALRSRWEASLTRTG
ncbi:M48 family metalloprotease [Spiribacter vilamensis]|uniref:Putative Zn-dependent protease n=1 Tax=Spiribacter vilamensis TaxID=531306 RepID=A0A4Q8D179_9GAMM|nr:M48 family metalloprotease [Spiribacter vilamensis]RZU99054.1 putative Zn-dependent protease [Spiribacter vilamensis]